MKLYHQNRADHFCTASFNFKKSSGNNMMGHLKKLKYVGRPNTISKGVETDQSHQLFTRMPLNKQVVGPIHTGTGFSPHGEEKHLPVHFPLLHRIPNGFIFCCLTILKSEIFCNVLTFPLPNSFHILSETAQ
jgi:hypothetical protein